MKFYNREKELALLAKIEDRSRKAAQMTFLVGRRRIGKTSLLVKAYPENSLYFFVEKKNEALLCEEFLEEIKNKLHVAPHGEIKTFKNLFIYLMDLSVERSFTLIIDEFQEFSTINSAVYSEMQHIWDKKKAESRINLILCGSIYSMMHRIFENSKEPLFGRATQRIHLKEFGINTLKEILEDNAPNYSSDDLLAFYMLTGGVARYVELLVEAQAFTLPTILDEFFSENSFFLDEGKNVLIDEFGKDYGNYFSILSLIAASKTSRPEIESILEMQIGGYLDRLEADFNIIGKVRPMFAKPGSRSVKYQIYDNFLNFWFRFIYKYRSAVEMGNLQYVRTIVERDYAVYSGRVLEKYFMQQLKQSGCFSEIGSYWESGNKNEIDIVGVNDLEKTITFVEVKRKRENVSLEVLKEKSTALCAKFKGYNVEYRALGMEDM
ncbi:ATP-binding protein [Bacteroides sp. 519]|uniref:ATP-binding protein n=1 Tax=Bacteroides sp. 519 TaxID=2302937 RepID=UPI0013D64519|nr:ATP-binding protein [Bacteroides sp. 519]NDV56636.1 ATP-binding protein [Bacteroides sp. 519]